MQTLSGNDTKIPDHAIEITARCLLPMIRAYYESAEGQAELAEWSKKKTLKAQDYPLKRRHDRYRGVH